MDSGIVCTIIHEKLANAEIENNKNSFWVKLSGLQDLKTLSNDIIKIVVINDSTVKCNDWSTKDVILQS